MYNPIKHCIFFEHNSLWYPVDLRDNLYNAIENEIKSGTKLFSVGTRGAFDRMALTECKKLREIYPDIKIRVIFTNINILKNPISPKYKEQLEYYKNEEVIIYPIENVHYKGQIIASNKFMVDDCSIVICYVDLNKSWSGAGKAVKYAIQKNKDIINLYQDDWK